MSDLAETIAAYRGMTTQYYSHDFISISHTDLTRLLDAAEAGAKAADVLHRLATQANNVAMDLNTGAMDDQIKAAFVVLRALRRTA